MDETRTTEDIERLNAEVATLNKKCNALLLLIIEQQASMSEMLVTLEELADMPHSAASVFTAPSKASFLN